MKKLLVVLMVLSIATVANAGLVITGVPTDPIMPSDTIQLGVMAVADELADQPAFLIVAEGPGSLGADNALNLVNEGGVFMWEGDPLTATGVFMDLVIPVLNATLPNGQVVEAIDFHCDGPGDVTLLLVKDYSFTGQGLVVMDTAVIHQIPEPMTLGLLGIGGLFLRRRK